MNHRKNKSKTKVKRFKTVWKPFRASDVYAVRREQFIQEGFWRHASDAVPNG
jgi:hypothetical protein